MIVVDCTVLADWAFGSAALKARSVQLSKLDPVWVAPSLIRYELGNVACTLGRSQADWDARLLKKASDAALTLIHELVPAVDQAETLALALDCDLTFYDAAYVWLAKTLGVRLYTRDRKLRRQAPTWTASVDSF